MVMLVFLHCAVARSQPAQEVQFLVDGKVMRVKAYLPEKRQARPAVIVLHGRGGFDAFHDGFERYATSLANAGFEAYLFPYYDDEDIGVMNSNDRQRRQSHFRVHIGKWSNRVEQAGRALLARERPATGVGLIGFSNGGFVAIAAAGNGKVFSALAVLYGGLPDWLPGSVTILAPTLIIHGEADRVVPIAEGEKLRDYARHFGTHAEFVRVPNADHGFDLIKDDSRSVDTRLRVTTFLASILTKQ